MQKRSFITQLIILILVLIVGLPVIFGLGMILIMGFFLLFALLVMSIGVISAPFIAQIEPSIAMLIKGIPQNTVVFLGIGITALTVALFILYISVVRHAVMFLIDTIRKILGVEVRHG